MMSVAKVCYFYKEIFFLYYEIYSFCVKLLLSAFLWEGVVLICNSNTFVQYYCLKKV